MELNDVQLKQLAEFTSNSSLIFIAGVIAPFFSGVDRLEVSRVLLGLALAVLSLVISLFILRKEKR